MSLCKQWCFALLSRVHRLSALGSRLTRNFLMTLKFSNEKREAAWVLGLCRILRKAIVSWGGFDTSYVLGHNKKLHLVLYRRSRMKRNFLYSQSKCRKCVNDWDVSHSMYLWKCNFWLCIAPSRISHLAASFIHLILFVSHQSLAQLKHWNNRQYNAQISDYSFQIDLVNTSSSSHLRAHLIYVSRGKNGHYLHFRGDDGKGALFPSKLRYDKAWQALWVNQTGRFQKCVWSYPCSGCCSLDRPADMRHSSQSNQPSKGMCWTSFAGFSHNSSHFLND